MFKCIISVTDFIALVEPFFLYFNTQKKEVRPDKIVFEIIYNNDYFLKMSVEHETIGRKTFLTNLCELHNAEEPIEFNIDYDDFIREIYRFVRMQPEQPFVLSVSKEKTMNVYPKKIELKFENSNFWYGCN